MIEKLVIILILSTWQMSKTKNVLFYEKIYTSELLKNSNLLSKFSYIDHSINGNIF